MPTVTGTENNVEMTLGNSQPWARKVLMVLFALSGFSGLIYENTWSYYLKLFLGHAAYAQTLVLAIFMGGMAIGAWTSARYSTRWSNALRAYAITEGIIGVFGLVFHPTFEWTTDLAYSTVLPSLGNPLAVTLVKWSLSTILILPQSILLGMTFPLMSVGLLRRSMQSSGATIAGLYFFNSFGAAIGGLASGFWLVVKVGLPGTMLAAALLNVAIALAVWLIARPLDDEAEPAGELVKQADDSPTNFYWLMLGVSLLTGVASFIYEISWIRMLSLILGSSTHSFELMLSAFILGLAFGGLWVKRHMTRIHNPVQFLGKIQLAMGLCAMGTIALYTPMFDVMQVILSAIRRSEYGYMLFNILSYGLSLGLMLPATFCAGMTLPLITSTLLNHRFGERSVGHVYAANTVGAIIGVFGATHLGMPMLGMKGLMTTGAALDMCVGVAVLWYLNQKESRLLPVGSIVTAMLAIAISVFVIQWDYLKMASGIYRTGEFISPVLGKVVFHKDGKTATVDVVDHGGNMLTIRTNGKPDASMVMGSQSQDPSLDGSTMRLLGAIPLALNPQAKTVANIGFGSGTTGDVLLGSPHLERLDTIEIEAAMVEGAQHFRPKVEKIFSDPRSHVHFEDAKTFFSTHGSRYDVIVSEPSNPWVSGVSSLFSAEFYRLARKHLTEQGILVQWMHTYEMDSASVVSVLKAMMSNFREIALYQVSVGDLVVVASNGGNISTLSGELFDYPSVRKALSDEMFHTIGDLDAIKIANVAMLQPLIASMDVQPNSDYFPFLDLNSAKSRFLGVSANGFASLAMSPIPVFEMLDRTSFYLNSGVSPGAQPLYSKGALMVRAQAMGQYFRGGEPAAALKMSPSLQKELALIRLYLMECRGGEDMKELMGSLLSIAGTLNPYLSPREADRFWTDVESSSCFEKLPAWAKNWVALFKAVGNRDGKAMVVLSESLLADKGVFQQGRKGYLLMAGMTGALAQHDAMKARSLWEQFAPKMLMGRMPGLAFQLLVAHSEISPSSPLISAVTK